MFSFVPLHFTLSSDDSFELCEFSRADLPEIVSVEFRASLFPWSEQNFNDSIDSSHICVGIKREEKWCAHAVFSIAADEAELLILAVDPQQQGRGLAKYLLSEMERQLRQCASALFLEVRQSNVSAIGLYEGLGFNQVGLRADYYPLNNGRAERENALIYAKQIDDEGMFGDLE